MSEGPGANKVGQILLIVGAIVLALLIGVLIGRKGQSPDMTSQAPPGVQITTDEPPARPTAPLEAPVQAPPSAPPAQPPPDIQVQEDAAAVGMTTRDETVEKPAAPAPEPTPAQTPPSAAQPSVTSGAPTK